MNAEPAAPDIIVKFTPVQVVSVVMLTVLAGVILSSEPLMLGAMLQAHRITGPQIGHAATAELLAMAAVAALACNRLKPKNMKAIATVAVAITCFANFLSIFANGNELVLTRLLSGTASGIFPWVLSGMVVRSPVPARIYGATNAVVNITGLCFVQLTSRFFLPHFGAGGPYGMMCGFSFLMLIPALLIRNDLPVLPKISHEAGSSIFRALIALFGVVAFAGAFMACWVYLAPVAAQLGYTKTAVTTAISISVIFLILGSMSAAVLGKRAGYFVILLPAIIASLLLVVALNAHLGVLAFTVAVVALCYIWNISMPFIGLPFIIAADPSHRTAMYSFSVQLAGCAVGPFLASLFVTSQNLRASLGVSFFLYALSLVVVVGVHLWVSAKRGTSPVLLQAQDPAE
jgi:DHA1 family inner membrane transport protein